MHTPTIPLPLARSLLTFFHLYPQPAPPSAFVHCLLFHTSHIHTHNILTFPRITYLAYGLSIFYHRCQPRVLLLLILFSHYVLTFPFVNSTFFAFVCYLLPWNDTSRIHSTPFFLLVYAFYKPTSHVMDAFLVVTFIPSSKKYNHVPFKHNNIVSSSACKSSFLFSLLLP